MNIQLDNIRSSSRLFYNYLVNKRKLQRGSVSNLLPICFIYFITYKCNLRCKFCDNGHKQKYPDLKSEELSTEDALKVIRTIRRDCSVLYITGGEPLLRKDLSKILRAGREMSYYPIFVNTNGTLLEKQDECIDHLDWLVISLNSLNEEKHDRIVGKAGATKLVEENIIKYSRQQKKRNFNILVNCVINKETVEDCFDVIDFCIDNNVFFTPVSGINGVYPDWSLLDNENYLKLIDYIIQKKRNRAKIYGHIDYIRSLLRFEEFDCFPTMTPHIDPAGYLLYPCPNLETRIDISIRDYMSCMGAYEEGSQLFGEFPVCDNRCHLSCYLSPQMIFRHPFKSLREMLYLFWADKFS